MLSSRFFPYSVVLFIAVLAGTVWYAKNNMEFVLFGNKDGDRFYIGVELPRDAFGKSP